MKKILVAATGGLAGFVSADAAFRALRARHADDHITLLTTIELGRLAKAAPYFDRVFTDGAPGDAEARKSLAKKLRRERFARVYELGCSGGGLRPFFGFFAPKWVGPPQAARKTAPSHPVTALGALLDRAGIEGASAPPHLDWTLEARKDAANMKPSWYGLSGDFGLLIPGVEDDKRWPAERWAEFATTLSEAGVAPVLIGGRDQQSFANIITRRCPSLVNLAGKTDLLQAAALAEAARFFVADDAPLVHLCAAAGCGGVILIGAHSDADAATPRGAAVVRLIAPNLGDIPIKDALRTLGNAGLLPHADYARRSVFS